MRDALSTPRREPLQGGVLDRLLLFFCPLGLLAAVLGMPLNARLGAGWLSGIEFAALLLGLTVAFFHRRIDSDVRMAVYGGCFAVVGLAEMVVWGLGGSALLLLFVAVLLVSFAPRRAVRLGGTIAAAGGLVLVAGADMLGWLPRSGGSLGVPMTPGAWGSALALFAFAGAGIVFCGRLGVSLSRTNAALRLAEGHFRTLFEQAADAILLFEDGRIVGSNVRAEILFGYTAQELLALAPADLSPDFQSDGAATKDEVQRRMAATLLQGPQHFRWLHRRRDGGLFEAEVSLNCTHCDGRRVMLAVVRCAMDFRMMEQENRLLATALNHAGEAVAITDAAGLIVYVNRAFEDITGYTRAEVHGKNPRVLRSGAQDVAFYRDMWATITSGRVWRGRFRNRRKDGGLFTEKCSITPLRGEDGRISHYVAVKRDISHELELEEQLVQSRKMEAIGRLAGGIAHDFNNILQVITGNVAMAAMDAPAGHPVHSSLDEISRAGERAVHLVQQLLAFSRREEPKLRPVEIGTLMTETARMLRRLIGEDISLTVTPPAAPLHVLADPVRIEQVLLNLCVNARDALPDGGCITVQGEVLEVDMDFCDENPEARAGRYVVMTVSDDGCGIPKEIQHRIFEPFFSTKEVGRGTGLGLATVYAIVKQHGGFIHLRSEVGLGTTFRIHLPAATVVPEETALSPAENPASLKARGETLLIAEDDEQVLAIAERVLQQAGYRVLVARDGEEALTVHAAQTESIHLAILDVVMPRRNGRLTFETLRARDPNLRVLFATGYSYHHLQDGLGEQASVLRKPFTPHELLVAVRTALDASPEPLDVATP